MHVHILFAKHTRYPNSHICTHCCYLMSIWSSKSAPRIIKTKTKAKKTRGNSGGRRHLRRMIRRWRCWQLWSRFAPLSFSQLLFHFPNSFFFIFPNSYVIFPNSFAIFPTSFHLLSPKMLANVVQVSSFFKFNCFTFSSTLPPGEDKVLGKTFRGRNLGELWGKIRKNKK